MLKKAFIISFLGLIIVVALFFTNLFIISKKDVLEFHANLKQNSHFHSHTAYQNRKNVKKDLYIISNYTRKHYGISSDLSQIFVNKNNFKYELVENLNNITFICYENVLENSSIQHIKYIQANNGLYKFPSHKFELNDVNLSFINTIKKKKYSEEDFQDSYFKGKASKLDFAIHKKKPTIEATSFVGSFNPKKGIKCEK